MNEHLFTSLPHAQVIIEAWRREYNEERPLQVPGLANVRALSFGMGHASALLGDGTLRMWGYDGFGQIGVGTSAGGQGILGQNLRVPTLMPLP